MTRVYDENFFNPDGDFRRDDETLGFIPALIGAAPGIFQAVMGLFGGGRKAQYQGLAEINAAGSQAVQTMQQILAGLQSGQMSPQQAVSEAQRIVQQSNDPSIVYPAKKGNDAAARNNFIQQLNQLLQQVQTAASQVAQAQQAAGIDPATGRPIPGSGISSSTLLLVGGGLLGVYLLTSQNQNRG